MRRPSSHQLWGSGRGPVRHLAPPTRLAGALVLFATAMAAPLPSLAGTALVALTTVAWLVACRPSARLVGSSLLFGLALFLPYLLLAPWVEPTGSDPIPDWSARLAPPAAIVIRGLAALLVSVATVSSLRVAELGEALGRLPVPRLVVAIVLQIVHQSGTLVRESQQIAAALAVRGALGRHAGRWRLLASLPQMWLPRVAFRAERVAAVMELRGFGWESLDAAAATPLRRVDVVAVVLTLGLLAAAIALRLGVSP